MNVNKVVETGYIDEQGRMQVTGTKIGDKIAMDVKITTDESGGGAPVDMMTDLTDKISVFDLYAVNNIEDSEPMLIGLSTLDGAWLVKKFISATGEMTYANLSNNSGYTSYDDAWTNRAILTFNKFHNLTGV